MSMNVKVDASGAVLLPAELCRAAGMEPGAELVAEVQAGRVVLDRAIRCGIHDDISVLKTRDQHILGACGVDVGRRQPL